MIHVLHLDTIPEVAKQLEVISGVKVRRGRSPGVDLAVPRNAVSVINRVIASLGIPFKWKTPLELHVGHLLKAHPQIREWVPAYLTKYQHDTSQLFAGRSGGLWWSAGAGKSAAATMWGVMTGLPCLVITRAAARQTLTREIQKYTTCSVNAITGRTPVASLPTADFHVIGWETIVAHRDALIRHGFQSVVFDESHKCKSHRRWKAVPEVDHPEEIKFVKLENISSAAADISRAIPHHLATTATPLTNRPRDLWAQFDLMFPGEWGGFYQFCNRYADAHPSPWGGIDTSGASHQEELKERLQGLIHRVDRAESHRELPPKRRQLVYIPIEDQCRAEGFANENRSVVGTSKLELELTIASAKKRPAIVGLAGDSLRTGGKVLVFTARRVDCDKLAAAIKKDIKDISVWIAHGGHSIAARNEMVDAYMAHPGPCCLVGTGDSMGESISLHDTDLMILAMLPYTPGQIEQWEGRVFRLGMRRPVLIVYMIAEGTADEHVASILLEKLPAVDAIVGNTDIKSLIKDMHGDESALIASLVSKLGEEGL